MRRWASGRPHGWPLPRATSVAMARCSPHTLGQQKKAALSIFYQRTPRCQSRRFTSVAKPAGPEILSLEPKYRGWCKVYVATIRLAEGQTVTREIEDHGAAACVLPYDPVRRTALLIRQLRAPPLHAAGEAAIIETPAGLIDPGEDAQTTARREAMEEAGVRLSSLEQVSNTWTM